MSNLQVERFGNEWHDNVSEAQDYVRLNIDDVEKVNDQWRAISEHVDTGDLDSMPLVEGAKRTLTEEQDASVRSLLEEGLNVPYEDMYEYVKVREARVNEIRTRINDIEHTTSEKQAKLLRQKQLLESIAPSVKGTLEDVTTAEIEKLKTDELEILNEERDKAMAALELATDLFVKTGKEWPLTELADIHYEPAENEIFTIDQFPNEREDTSEQIIERVMRKFESRLNDASVYLALLLKEKPGHIWTGEELGAAIYDDESDEKRNGNRISALISNYRRGKVPIMAEEFGDSLVLQRGKRQLFDARTGKSIPNTIRVVWRLVDLETAINAQIITTLNSERTIRQSYGEWEPTDIVKIQLSQLPSGEYDGKSAVSVVNHEDDRAEQDHDKNGHEKQDWTVEFTSAVHATIEELKAEDLLSAEGATWKSLRIRSQSAKLGTETMRERAFKNKIIKRSEMGEDSSITMSQLIMAAMQNNHPNIFRVSSRRKQAFEIVDQIVAGYLRAHEA